MQQLAGRARRQRNASTIVVWATMALSMLLATSAHGAPPIPADSGRSLGGFLIPIQPRTGDISLRSLRAWRWRVDDTQRLLLTGDVLVDVAGWQFEAEEALIWLDRVSTHDGLITQVAIYLPEVRPGTQASTGSTRGRNLLIVGTVKGKTLLDTALIRDTPPPAGMSLVQRGEQRLAGYVASIRKHPPKLGGHPTVTHIDANAPSSDNALPIEGSRTTTKGSHWLRRPGATIAFSADKVVVAGGKDDSSILADGSVAIEYRPSNSSDPHGKMRLSAERAVVFMEPGTLEDIGSRDLRAEDIRGVYLEGGVIAVAERDDYEVRAPRMYYDFQNDRAIMVDAVLRTYDRQRRAPVVARADELRQLAEGQWSADNVVLSASSFATPTLALASRKAMLTRTAPTMDAQGLPMPSTVQVEATDNTIDVAGVPIFWWPHFQGGPQDIPLRGTKTGWGRYEGAIVETTWDIYALLGLDRDAGIDLQLEVDGYSNAAVAQACSGSETSLAP